MNIITIIMMIKICVLFLSNFLYLSTQLLLMPQKPYTGAIAAADAMNFNQKASFDNGYQTVLLLPDTMLWRFVSKQGDRRFGSFWMDEQTMQIIMRTLYA